MFVRNPRGELVEYNGEPPLNLPFIEEEVEISNRISDGDPPKWD